VRLDIDHRELALERGDLFLLTTDGIHGYLPHDTLRQILAESEADLESGCARLLAAAAQAGSPDNMTCQLLRVDALPLENPDEVYQRLARLPFPPPLAPGMRIDGYQVEEELFASSRSQVYRVRALDGRSSAA
jgi:hypothetical protein